MVNQQGNPYDKEIDFNHVSGKIGGFFTSISDLFFDVILFVKKYYIILLILLVIGVGLGYYKDSKYKPQYESKLFVVPNFRSADYLYSQVDLLNSKIGDKEFLQQNGMEYGVIKEVEVQPVVDIYEYIEEPNDPKYMILKLMADSGEIAKILEEKITSKNYKYQALTITTAKPVDEEKFLKPLMKYFNANPYLQIMQKEWANNLEIKIKENDTLIKQINGILNNFGTKGQGSAVFYNEEASIHEVIKAKEKLISDQGKNRIDRINYEKIIKDASAVLNIERYGMLAGKMKLLYPLILILAFACLITFRTYYKKQMNKRQLAASNNE